MRKRAHLKNRVYRLLLLGQTLFNLKPTTQRTRQKLGFLKVATLTIITITVKNSVIILLIQLEMEGFLLNNTQINAMHLFMMLLIAVSMG